MKNENYYVIQGWMINELQLFGHELLVYAVINGFSQDEQGKFDGSLQYISSCVGVSKITVHKILKSLVKRNLLQKREYLENNVKRCEYKVLKNFKWGIKETYMGIKDSYTGGIKETLTNNNSNINIDINNIKDNIDEFLSSYKEICTNLPQVRELSLSRRNKIKARLKDAPIETWKEVFTKINNSSFCCGNNDRKWTASFDWIISNDNNYLKVLEGKYDTKQQELLPYNPYR